jgi:integrase
MHDLYVRHRLHCKNAKKDQRGKPPRQIFGCGCPIYARVEIRDPVTKEILFRHNGSLKGITTKEAAEELVTNWHVKYLSGETPPAHLKVPSVTVEQAVTRYLADKQSVLPKPKPVAESEYVKNFWKNGRRPRPFQFASVRKLSDVLTPLIEFMAARGVTYLKDIKTEHLNDLQETWKGRLVIDPKTGGKIQLPKSQHSRVKYQQTLKRFFKRSRVLGWIQKDPAELLLCIRVSVPEIKVYGPEEKQNLLDVIPKTFPQKHAMVRAFVLVLRYTALRMSDVVSLEIANFKDGGITLPAQRKTDEPIYCALKPSVVEALRRFEPKSEKYFFWTGNGQLDSALKDWSATMLKLYRAAGFPELWQGGKRSHNWRDTLAMEILEHEDGRLEDAQIALGHRSRKTTEKYYTALSKKRAERVTALKQKLWQADEAI